MNDVPTLPVGLLIYNLGNGLLYAHTKRPELIFVSATIVVSIEVLWRRRLRAEKRIRENNV